MIPLQVRLEAFLTELTPVAALMRMTWSWPIAESLHFIGLTLLFGSIAVWDLRLIGLAREVPLIRFHRLIPFAILGFTINAITGALFIVTYPDQYVYNSAFHLKLLCLLLAGLNVGVFYATMFRRVTGLAPGEPAPIVARLNGAISLGLWTVILICGRMITFFRPPPCNPADAARWLADCIVR